MDFKRGNKVNYRANRDNKNTPANVMNGNAFGTNEYSDVDGTFDKSYFMASNGFPDGFESVHSKELKDGLKYIHADAEELTKV